MQVAIFCAGMGERLGEVTQVTAKPAIELNGTSCISRLISFIREEKIIEEDKRRQILINLHHLGPTVVEAILKDHSDIKHCFTFTHENELLNTARTLGSWSPIIYERDILVFNGDMLIDVNNLKDLLDFHTVRRSYLTIGCKGIENEDLSEKGVVISDETGRVQSFVEKPENGLFFEIEDLSTLINAGVYVINKRLLKYIPVSYGTGIGQHFIPEMVARNKKVYSYILDGNLIDIGTPENLETAKELARLMDIRDRR